MTAPQHMMSARFTAVSQAHGGKMRRAWAIRCCGCDAVAELADTFGVNTRDGQLAKKFARMGWLVGRNAAHDLCPACVAAARVKVKPSPAAAEARAGVTPGLAVAAPPPPAAAEQQQQQGEGETMPETPRAEPPRTMGRDDRRRIHETIDAAWADERGCYLAGASDKSIAETLKVPWAWVAQVRNEAFGERDINEKALDGLAGLAALIGRAEALEARALDLAAEAETLRRDAEAWRKAAGA